MFQWMVNSIILTEFFMFAFLTCIFEIAVGHESSKVENVYISSYLLGSPEDINILLAKYKYS